MTPQSSLDARTGAVQAYETQILNKEGFKHSMLAVAGLRDIPEDNFDSRLIVPELSFEVANRQVTYLMENGVDEYSARIISAVGEPHRLCWGEQINAYNKRMKEGYQGLGLGFAAAATGDTFPYLRKDSFLRTWNEARRIYGDNLTDPSLLSCQCAVIPFGVVNEPNAVNIVRNVPYVVDSLRKAGLTDRYASGIMGAHFSHFAAMWGYGNLPYDGIVAYYNELQRILNTDSLSTAILAISPTATPVAPNHRYFEGNNRYVKQTKAVFDKAKGYL